MAKLNEVWPNWPKMPPEERVARIMALKDDPQGVDSFTKNFVDRHWSEYAKHAKIAIEESKCADSNHLPLEERIARIFALRDAPKPKKSEGLLGIMEGVVGPDIDYLMDWIEAHYREYIDYAKKAAEEISNG